MSNELLVAHITVGSLGLLNLDVKMVPETLGYDAKTEVRSTLNLMVMFPSDYGSTKSREAVIHLCWGSNPATG